MFRIHKELAPNIYAEVEVNYTNDPVKAHARADDLKRQANGRYLVENCGNTPEIIPDAECNPSSLARGKRKVV